MANSIRIGVLTIALGLMAWAPRGVAAQSLDDLMPAEEGRDNSYYNRPAGRPDARAIIHEKAQANAAQRRARLSSMSWYGMSNSRPTASPTPFATRYSPIWEMPGNRPFAWYARNPSGFMVYTR